MRDVVAALLDELPQGGRPPGADLGELGVLLDLDAPALVVDEVPVEDVEFVLRHQVEVGRVHLAPLETVGITTVLVAQHSGVVKVGADGKAVVSFDMPDFNGTVRLMAMAWSKQGVGHADRDVIVRDPVVVTASLPRFMAPGDESRLLLEIVHASGPFGQMGLTLAANGVALGDVPASIDLGEKQKVVVAVPVVADATGSQTVTVTLTTPDGKQLKKTLTVPVQMNDPQVVRVSRLTLASGQEFTFDDNAFAGLVPGSGRATMAVGPLARINAPGILAALDRYPYGCTEQITSKALPLLYFDQVAVALVLGVVEGQELRL